jgi:hypothetical protein
MGGYLIGLQYGLANWLQKNFILELTGLLFLIISGAALYGGMLYLLRLQELTFLVDKVIGKIRR